MLPAPCGGACAPTRRCAPRRWSCPGDPGPNASTPGPWRSRWATTPGSARAPS